MVYARPENERVVKGSASQNLPCVLSSLLSLAALLLLLWR
jgi:hypothetical protein